MIEIIETNGKDCPVFVCDECKERITDAQEAIVVFGMNKPTTAIRTIHKICDSDKYRIKNGWHGWNDLDVFLFYLKKNVKYRNERDVTSRAEALEML